MLLGNINLRPKLVVIFLLIGLVPLFLAQYVAKKLASEALLDKTYSQLESTREIKKASISGYFKTVGNQVITFSENGMVIEAMRDFNDAFHDFRSQNSLGSSDVKSFRSGLEKTYDKEFAKEYQKLNNQPPANTATLKKIDDEAVVLQHFYVQENPYAFAEKDKFTKAKDRSYYTKLHERVHPLMRTYRDKFGFADIYLVDPKTGDVVYSVAKKPDFGTSLIDGPYADTNLGKVAQEALKAEDKNDIFQADFASYLPSFDQPASFISSPISYNDKVIGVLIFQLTPESVNAIMAERTGLGNTGESYLVGADHLMRSDSHNDPENRSVTASFLHPDTGKVQGAEVDKALGGASGAELATNYAGQSVISAYGPVEINGMKWALLAEIGAGEALAPVAALEHHLLLIALGLAACIAVVAFFVANGIASPLKKVATFAQYVAKGDFTEDLDVHQKDEVGQVADALRSIPEYLSGMLKEIDDVTEDISCGKLRTRGNRADFSGEFANLVDNINVLLDELVGYLDEIPSPLMTVDRDMKVLFLNRTAQKTTGKEEGKAIGGRCDNVFNSNDCGTEACAVKRAMKSGVNECGETSASVNEQTLEIEYIAVPNRNRHGDIVGAFEVVIDRTDMIRARRTTEQLAQEAGIVSDRLAAAAEQLSAQVEQTSRGTDIQRTKAAETALAMEQMNATVMEVAKNASDSAGFADQTRGRAETGSQTMSEVVGSIESVNALSARLAENMQQLGLKAESIGQIINVINDIADQTNLLALNAAIEAARAGDAGRGFAVVADEVRKLAEKTMQATNEVETAIREIQEGTKTNLRQTEEAVEAVQRTTSLAEASGESLRDILEMAANTSDRVNAIAVASEEQSATADEINRSSEEINRISSETSEAMVQSSTAITELAELAQSLNKLIVQLHKG